MHADPLDASSDACQNESVPPECGSPPAAKVSLQVLSVNTGLGVEAFGFYQVLGLMTLGSALSSKAKFQVPCPTQLLRSCSLMIIGGGRRGVRVIPCQEVMKVPCTHSI